MFWGYYGQIKKYFHIPYDRWNGAVNSLYLLSSQKEISLGQKTTPTDIMIEKTYHLAPQLGHFGTYLMVQQPI